MPSKLRRGRFDSVRPPGSVPEPSFLQMCVRCGECLQACPNNVLWPVQVADGTPGLWTPRVNADWAGCEPSCNNCGQVCPTGAIRQLRLEEKRAARMGLAVVDRRHCLPWMKRGECRLCADECTAAGYAAIEFERVGVEVDSEGFPVPGSGFSAPVVIPHKCVGCGLCQSICNRLNCKVQHLLRSTAVRVMPGPGREDRLLTGSYVALRRREALWRRQEQRRRLETGDVGDFY